LANKEIAVQRKELCHEESHQNIIQLIFVEQIGTAISVLVADQFTRILNIRRRDHDRGISCWHVFIHKASLVGLVATKTNFIMKFNFASKVFLVAMIVFKLCLSSAAPSAGLDPVQGDSSVTDKTRDRYCGRNLTSSLKKLCKPEIISAILANEPQGELQKTFLRTF
jgi:uncharacterized membrane protein YhaH (DUF805 family)